MGRLKRLLSGATQPALQERVTSSSSMTNPRLSFLSLPVELRDQIYSLIAQNTDLVFAKSSIFKSWQGPSLLLTNKQIHREYSAFLYSLARITIVISGYDFRPVQSVVGSLYRQQLKAMRENKHFMLRLNIGRSFERVYWEQLRKWLSYRSSNIDRLPWRYETSIVQKNLSAQERLQYYKAHQTAIREYSAAAGLGELAIFELQPIMSCIDGEIYRTEMILTHLQPSR